MKMLFTLISIIQLITISNAGCPFAAMMNTYNFTGDWSYNISANSPVAYLMHICHFPNNEVYFSIVKNNTNDLIGFGSGNWSQSNMMIGGQVFEINNGTSYWHGFGIGMNMQVHKWWIQDPYKSQPLDEGQKGTADDYIPQCIIPYGIDIRNAYFTKFWDAKRKFHRTQRIEKRRRERAKTKKLRAEKKKPIYVKYYEKFLDFIGFGEQDQFNATIDAIINAKFSYDEKPQFPTLFGTSWTTDNGLMVTFIDENNGCFNGEMFTNITVAFYSMGINAIIEKENGIKNGQFFVQTEENKLVGSSIVFKLNDEGEIIEDKINGFTMEKMDKLMVCEKGELDGEMKGKGVKCDEANGEKCEL
eukprot:370684_1